MRSLRIFKSKFRLQHHFLLSKKIQQQQQQNKKMKISKRQHTYLHIFQKAGVILIRFDLNVFCRFHKGFSMD